MEFLAITQLLKESKTDVLLGCVWNFLEEYLNELSKGERGREEREGERRGEEERRGEGGG